MNNDDQIITEISRIVREISTDNIGNIYIQSLELYNQINDISIKFTAEYYFNQIRSYARDADIGWRVFTHPYKMSKNLTNDEYIQIITIISVLKSFCYGVERLDEVSTTTGPNSTPVRFYINSIYHHIAALFLLEKGNDPTGGMVYKVLEPMGIASFLDPIKFVLNKPMREGVSFGETIRRIRNDFLVHGTFSPDDIITIIDKTKLRDVSQQLLLNDYIWELFNQSLILFLKLISILTFSNLKIEDVFKSYLSEKSNL